jgi:hypothetical protein
LHFSWRGVNRLTSIHYGGGYFLQLGALLFGRNSLYEMAGAVLSIEYQNTNRTRDQLTSGLAISSIFSLS